MERKRLVVKEREEDEAEARHHDTEHDEKRPDVRCDAAQDEHCA